MRFAQGADKRPVYKPLLTPPKVLWTNWWIFTFISYILWKFFLTSSFGKTPQQQRRGWKTCHQMKRHWNLWNREKLFLLPRIWRRRNHQQRWKLKKEDKFFSSWGSKCISIGASRDGESYIATLHKASLLGLKCIVEVPSFRHETPFTELGCKALMTRFDRATKSLDDGEVSSLARGGQGS